MFDCFNNNTLILNLKPGKMELVIYGTAWNLATQLECNVELKGSKINHATHYEYLGVSLDQHLTMSQQTTKIYTRINQRLKQLRRVHKNLIRSTAETICVSMIEPISLYCAPIYAGIHSHANKLKKLEGKAKNTVRLTNHNNIERKIKIWTATEVFKCLNGIKKNDTVINFNYFNHSIGTRGNGNRLVPPKSTNKAGWKSFIIQGALTYNLLSGILRKENFICRLKRILAETKF